MATDRVNELRHSSDHEESPNVVVWAGIAFGLVAAVLYGILFYMLSKLPSTRNELEELRTNAPALTRLLFAGASAGLLNIVSLILCLTGYVLPGRSRFAAIVGILFSGLMFLAVFSIVIISLL